MKKLPTNLFVATLMLFGASSTSAQNAPRSIDSRTGVYQNWTATVRVTPGASQATGAASVVYPALRQELLERLERDQAIRDEWIKKGVEKRDAEFEARMIDIDSSNTARIKEIVKQSDGPARTSSAKMAGMPHLSLQMYSPKDKKP